MMALEWIVAVLFLGWLIVQLLISWFKCRTKERDCKCKDNFSNL